MTEDARGALQAISDEGWRQFIAITEDAPPWPAMLRAAERLGRTGAALDLACGAGRDSLHLARAGFDVTAVDASEASEPALRRGQGGEKVHFVRSRIEDFDYLPGSYDLVNAQYALPFVPAQRWDATWSSIVASLRPGGVIAATFFGLRDAWHVAGLPLVFHSREGVEALLAPFAEREIREVEEDGHIVDGTPKHWHLFHCLAVKASAPA